MHHDPTYLQKCLIYVNSTWVEHSQFSRPRHYAVTVTMDSGDIYVLGGSYSPTTSDVLYKGSDNWSAGPRLGKDSFIFKACATSINATHFVTIGGGIFYNMVDVFDTITNTWRQWPKLTKSRRAHNCALLGDKVVVAGGYLFGDQDYTSSSVLIDVHTGEATAGGEMVMRRAYYSVQVIEGIMYAIGGSTFHHEETVEKLTDLSLNWTTSDLALVTGRSTFATVKCPPEPETAQKSLPKLLSTITIRTKVGCTNFCTNEGVIIKLKGGSSSDPDHEGFECSTETLNHLDTIDFGFDGVAKFGGRFVDDGERMMMSDCDQAPLNGVLQEGSLEWVGEKGWQPLDVCLDWQDHLGSLGEPDEPGLNNQLKTLNKTESVAIRCNLVPSGETYWHLEGCQNLAQACALS